MRRLSTLWLALWMSLAAQPALAWKGEPSGSVRSIAEVNAKAEEGDVLTIEGVIVSVSSGPGSLQLAVVEDETGKVLVAVAEYLRRELQREPGEDAKGVRVRVTGRWDHGYLDQGKWALRASKLERIASR